MQLHGLGKCHLQQMTCMAPPGWYPVLQGLEAKTNFPASDYGHGPFGGGGDADDGGGVTLRKPGSRRQSARANEVSCDDAVCRVPVRVWPGPWRSRPRCPCLAKQQRLGPAA